ncbi:DUF192 domain-containing protein [Nanoarchaeota archaeon]
MVDVEELKRKLKESKGEAPAKARVVNHGATLSVLISIVILLAAIMAVAMFITPEESTGKPRACFKHDVCIDLILAITAEEQEIGLSNYTSLPEDKGLLFIFKQPDVQGIWMKGMDFPIDIFWISSKGKIQDIEKDAQPCNPPQTQCEIFEPRVNAKYVLETNSGFASDTNLFDGERVTFENLPKVR